MLVGCVRVCVCACGWTNVYRKETRERNANVGEWAGSSRQPSFACSHTTLIRFFGGEGPYLHWRSCAFFHLIYIDTNDCLRPWCNRPLLQIQQGTVELFPNSCAKTRWPAGDGREEKGKKREKRKSYIIYFLRLLFGTFLLLSSSNTVIRNHN